MVATRFNPMRALCQVFVLIVLCGSPATARDPNEAASVGKANSASKSMEQTLHPEISRLRSRADWKSPSQTRDLSREIVRRWDNGVVDPEPALAEAWLERGEIDEYTGRMEYGSMMDMPSVSGTAPAALFLVAVDEDDDLLGIHVREKYVLPNGVKSSFEETYPAFITRAEKSFLGATVIPVYLRYGNHVKDEARWQAYVDEVSRDARSRKIAQPEIWITEPDPNAVAVSISVYDKKGHESGILSVPLLSPDPKATTTWDDRQAMKSYKEQATKMARWPDEAALPRPDNAALLYYRAIACQPLADPCTVRIMTLMSHGREPDDRVRGYLGHCLDTIHLMQLASQIPQCDWGLVKDPNWHYINTTLPSLHSLRFLQTCHVETLTADGHYRAALENCLVLLRFARHIGDDLGLLFLASCNAHGTAMHGILAVLTAAPLDEQTLRWLRDQLDTVKGALSDPAATLDKCCDEPITWWRLHNGPRPFERAWALAQIEDEAARKEAAQLTDEQLLVRSLRLQIASRNHRYDLAVPEGLLARAREQFNEFAASAARILQSDLPYEDRQTELDGLERKLRACAQRHEPVALLQSAAVAFRSYHIVMTNATARSNCAKAAVELLLMEAETGQLPATIPPGLPKDPFTAADLEYERTPEGFILRFNPARIGGYGNGEFEFRTRSRQQREQSPAR